MRWERLPDRLPDSVGTLVVWAPDLDDDAFWRDALNWAAAGGTLVVNAESDRLDGRLASLDESTARPAFVSPSVQGVTEVSVGPVAFKEYGSADTALLVRQDGRPVLISWPYGMGRIIRSADDAWLTNARIDKANNLELALGILTPPAGSKVAFDEYHHGYQAVDRWYQILRGSLQVFLIELAFAIAVLYWAFGARFGAPLALPETPQRAAIEYVHSMSRLYRRARAQNVALQALYTSLSRELSRVIGGAGGLTHAEIASRAAPMIGLPAERIQSALDRLNPERKTPPTDKELIDLAREAEAIQRSMQHGRK